MFVFGGLSAFLFWACIPVPEPTGSTDPADPHVDFPLIGGHLPAACNDCHIDGAIEQGLAQPGEGWVDDIATECLGCHQDVVDQRFGGSHKEGRSCGEAGCHSISDESWGSGVPDPHLNFPLQGAHGTLDCDDCHVDAAAEQGLTVQPGQQTGLDTECTSCHEDTRTDLFGAGAHYSPTSCGNNGCHASYHECWATVYGGDCTGEPPQAGHVGDLAILFPLDAPHDVQGCSTCHAGAPAEQAGGSDDCMSCHTADRPADHYPPYDAAKGERDCKACHAGEDATGKLLAPNAWGVDNVVHDFPVPHGGDAECTVCHTTPGSQSATDYTCTNGCHGDLTTVSPLHQNFGGDCAGCHEDGEK